MTATQCDSTGSRDASSWSDTAAFGEVLSALETERERAATERDAFRAFAEEVASLDASTPSPASTLLEPDGSRAVLETVQTAYRETAMAVSHYDDEYGESLRENMAAELHQDVATAVVDGGQWSPHLQQLLLYRARVAARSREELLETIATERTSVETARDRLPAPPISTDDHSRPPLEDRPFSALVDRDATLREQINRCERALADRQREIHHVTNQYEEDELHFHSYLYGSLETAFPVLGVTLDRLRQLEERRNAVVGAIAHRE